MRYIRIIAIALTCMFATEARAVDDLTLLKAAHRGDVTAMRKIGMRMYRGVCSRGDSATGIRWLEKAAEGNDAEAMCYLGRVYAKKKDEKKAAEYLQNAIENGSSNAEKYLEELSLEYSKEIVEKKAKSGDYKACMRMLKACLLGGDGVEIDEDEAWEWFERACKLNKKSTMETLRSWKVSQTLPILEKLVEEDDDEDVIMMLAEIYEKGDGNVSADEEKAKKYYSDAASLGNLRAQAWLKERGLPYESKEERKERLAREADEKRKVAERERRQKAAAEERAAEKERNFFRSLLAKLDVQSAQFLCCRGGKTFDEELSYSIIGEKSDFSEFYLVGRVMQKIGERQFLARANDVPISVNVPSNIDVNFADGDKVEGIFVRDGEYEYETVSGQMKTVRNYILVAGSN